MRQNTTEGGAGEKRKDVGNQRNGRNQQNQSNLKKHKRNNNFQFKGSNDGNYNLNNSNRNQSGNSEEKIYKCRKFPRNHPRKDCDGKAVI